MLTPQEVSERIFPKASFGGYNMASVDAFLDELTVDYTALYKENASLKAKMKVLADSLEEYRATEKGMRHALLAAQQAADEMMKEVEIKKNDLLRNAEAEAKAQIEELQKKVANEEARLAAAQAATAEFVSSAREICRKQGEFLDSLPSVSVSESLDFAVKQTAQDIEDTIQKTFIFEVPRQEVAEEEEVAVEEEVEPEEEEEEGELISLYEELTTPSRRDPERSRSFDLLDEPMDNETSPTRRIDFDTLQFGSNYDLK